MSSVMPFTFNAVELYIATINEKPWTRPMEVCRALKYDSKTVDIVKNHCTRENIQHKYQLAVVPTAGTTVNWPRYSEKLDLYINEEGIIELLVGSQQPLAKELAEYMGIK